MPGSPETNYPHKVALLKSRFRLPERAVLLGRAQLFADRVELRGWGWAGRYRRTIALAQTIDMEYEPLTADEGRITIVLDTGEELRLVVQEAERWRQAFEGWLMYHVLAGAKLLSDKEHADDMAG